MKNTIIIKSLAILLALSMSSGCIKETFPQGGGQTAEQIMGTEGSLHSLLKAIPVQMTASGALGYAGRYQVHFDFGISAMHLMTESMLEDLATPSNPGYNWFNGFASNINMGSDYILCAYFWEGYYKWIKGANDVIGLIDEDSANEDNIKILGQALTYRAMFYLDLARMYIPLDNSVVPVPENIHGLTVPIVTNLTTEADSKFNPRVTYQDLYKFIMNDLDKAEKFLAGKAQSRFEPGIDAVHVLKARAFIELGMLYRDYPVKENLENYPCNGDSKLAYAEAAKWSRKVIDEGGYVVLNQQQWEDPKTGFNSALSNRSWIWGIPLSSENTGNLLSFTAHASTEATWGYAPLTHMSISKKLYYSISDSDFRKHSWLDPEFDKYYDYQYSGDLNDKANFLNGNPNYGIPAALPFQSIKFRPAQGEVTDHTKGGLADVLLMRVEEMYFIEMEAALYSGDLPKAQRLLNEFMATRYVGDEQYDCVAKTDSPESFIREMMLQKRIEFWGEGILFYDYKRLNQGITRSYPGTNHVADVRINCKGRSPQWNVVITRGEFQSNTAINDKNNNPDPSALQPVRN